jgi:hypothetical protein
VRAPARWAGPLAGVLQRLGGNLGNDWLPGACAIGYNRHSDPDALYLNFSRRLSRPPHAPAFPQKSLSARCNAERPRRRRTVRSSDLLRRDFAPVSQPAPDL